MTPSRYPLRLLPLALSAVLAACASTPPQRAPATSPAPLVVTPTPAPETPALADEPEPDAGNVWDRLRNSFAMPDCNADPAVLAWAHRYTRNPQRFEAEVRAALPKLTYVQQVAAKHDVAGEFVLLPWIESGFRPIPGRHGRPAGMWQIMPATASAMGLRVNSRYDARLDVQSAAEAVMKLLNRYHDQFGDWRVAAYAYNAGEAKAQQLVQRHGNPPDMPVIPRWPVRDVTREHLTRLLAMACIVREPERFHVSLPTLAPAQHLVSVPLPHSMPLAIAADHAGMSLDHLKELNAGFRNDVADRSVASYLVMPEGHAQRFRTMLVDQSASATADLRQGNVLADAPAPLPDAATIAPRRATAIPKKARTHRVKAGETLWQLARNYSVSVSDLRRWNHLQGASLRTGQVLKVASSH
ncbi:MAG TPA: transglycosylase SLT domain-containing protein [Rhodanobacter sp.]|nr:transglycosylase SLT domain-containing protein [Rhodanobacter sp.]